MIRALTALWLLVGFAAPVSAQSNLDTVDDLLQRASTALQEKDYKGRFTYESGNILETVEIVHAVKNGVEYERIQHLNGKVREFVRSGRSQDCVTMGSFLLRGGLVSTRTGAVSLAQNYHLYIRGSDRIAGREAAVLQAVPKDEYRYGMVLGVDKVSGLPLMSLVTSTSKTALERFQFVQLEVGDEIGQLDLHPESRTHRVLQGSVDCSRSDKLSGESSWQARWLPAGFLLADVGRDKSGRDVLTFTDGLASFSVFIDDLSQAEQFKTGVARRGATVAVMTVLTGASDKYGVVFVGEVPLSTAKRVVASLQPKR